MFRTPFFLPILFPRMEWRVAVGRKEVFLTFDDGPVPGPTEFVLDALGKFNARATFFCIGDNVRKHPGIFRDVLRAGHTIGNHTFNHLKGWNHADPEYLDNIALCNSEFLSNGWQPDPGKGKPLFRPPYGRISRSQANKLNDYRIIMWDVLTRDYSKNLAAEKCLRGTMNAIRPGSIVVFHDSLKAERNLTFVLPEVLARLSHSGYSFRTLDEV